MAPTRIEPHCKPTHPEGCPAWTILHYDFPAKGNRPAVKLSWYDCGKLPEEYPTWGIKARDGIVFVGDEGKLFAHYTVHQLLPEDKFKNYQPPAPTLTSSIGHHAEWVDACLRKDPSRALCNFDYAGPLAETVLLGNVAVRAGKSIEWDTENLRITNAPEATKFLHCEYRAGWTL